MSRKEYPTTTPDWQAAVKRRTRFYLFVAILLAILFGILVFQFFSDQPRIAPGLLTSVVFASMDIEQGTLITTEMLEVRDVPIKAVPESHLQYKELAIGKYALFPLFQGEVVLPGKLAGGLGSVLAHRCPVEKWCVNIPQIWFIAAPPDLAKGDRIEIASVLPGQELNEAGYIATNVQVIALPGGEESAAYVLAVDDQEALSLLYARANEFLLLVLLRPAAGG